MAQKHGNLYLTLSNSVLKNLPTSHMNVYGELKTLKSLKAPPISLVPDLADHAGLQVQHFPSSLCYPRLESRAERHLTILTCAKKMSCFAAEAMWPIGCQATGEHQNGSMRPQPGYQRDLRKKRRPVL